jgi:hypothetical protein
MWGLTPLYFFPALAIFAVLAAYGASIEEPPSGMVLWVAVGAVIVAVVLTLIGFVGLSTQPGFLVPRWYREQKNAERVERAAVATTSNLGEVHESWWVNWVYAPAATVNDHVLAGPGVIGGQLHLTQTGVVFRPMAVENALRKNRPVQELFLPVDALLSVATVPPGADHTGAQTPQPFTSKIRQSPHRRLVIHTTDSAHVFDIRKASQHADELAALYTIHRNPDI